VTEMIPFTTLLDLERGVLEPQREGITERRLSDMRGMFADESGDFGDPLIYRVLPVPVPVTNDNIFSSTTILEAGDINGEFFMTKGHFHEQRGRAEIYIGLAGEGRLLMATEGGRHAIEPMRRGTVNYVPGGWAHRSINVGVEPLIFFAAFVADAGHDYATVERTGFPVLVVRDGNGPRLLENPRYGVRA
jgi:glucose-6-phosphate isomerase, archaeal